MDSCDTAAVDGRLGSNVNEVKLWLWQFGRGKQRLGGLSIEKTGTRKKPSRRLLRRSGSCVEQRLAGRASQG